MKRRFEYVAVADPSDDELTPFEEHVAAWSSYAWAHRMLASPHLQAIAHLIREVDRSCRELDGAQLPSMNVRAAIDDLPMSVREWAAGGGGSHP